MNSYSVNSNMDRKFKLIFCHISVLTGVHRVMEQSIGSMPQEYKVRIFNIKTWVLRSVFGIGDGAVDVDLGIGYGYDRGSGIDRIVKFVST